MDVRDHRWWAGAQTSSWFGALLTGMVLLGFSGCGRGPEVSEERSGSELSAEHSPEQRTGRESAPEPELRHESGEAEEHEPGDEHGGEHDSEGEHAEESGESGIRYGVAETAHETRSGIRLALRFDAGGGAFTGTVTNTTTEPVARVRVEVHLSNGVELGPTPRIRLAPGETSPVILSVEGQRFEAWETHVEIGEGEHGQGSGHRGP